MIEVQVLIPLTDNDGTSFTAAHHGAFEGFVLERFGGISMLPGTVAGSWLEGGQTFSDNSRVYLIAMISLLEGSKLAEVVAFAKSHYRQEAIYFRYLGISEIYEG